MWAKEVLRAGMLVVITIVLAGCGATIAAETTATSTTSATSVEQFVETTSADT